MTRQSLVAAAALLACACLAHAQQPYTELEDGDAPKIARLLPLSTRSLKAAGTTLQGVVADFGQWQSMYTDLAVGRRSALEEIHRLVPGMPVLPGARYEKACSAQVSTLGSLTAVFSVPEASLIESTVKYYKTRGYQIATNGMGKDSIAMMTFDEKVWDHHPSVYATLHFEAATEQTKKDALKYHPACAALIDRPALQLSIDGVKQETATRAGQKQMQSAEQTVESATAKEGFTAEQYQQILMTLMQAAHDAADENAAQELAAMKAIPDLAPMAKVREHNLEWFRRHQTLIQPVWDDYQRSLDLGGK